MSAAQTVLIRPAPARGQRSYVATSEALEYTGKNGWTLRFEDLQDATFVQHRIGDQLFWRLDLEDGADTRRVETSFPYTMRRESEDCAAFITLSQLVSDILTESQPDFRIGYGEHGKARLVLFAIGVVATLGGVGLLVAALLTGVSGERLMGGGIAMGLLVVLGLILARGYNPWRKPIPVDVARFPKVLAYLAGRTSG